MLRNILTGKPRQSPDSNTGGAILPTIAESKALRRRVVESRSGTSNLTERIFHLVDSPASSGAVVNEYTSLNVAAVTACVRLIADMVAKLPIYLYRETKQGPKEITNHPAINLVGGIPCELHTSFELRQLMETGKGLGGNGYARIYRDAYGDPRSIQWLAPCDVTPSVVKKSNGERYVVYRVTGETEALTRYNIIHVRGISRDGIAGISPVTLLRESIGTCLAQTSAAGKLMREGTHFPGYLVAPQALTEQQMKDARDEWDKNTAGAKNAGRVPIMHGGFDFKQTNGMSMVDAEFLGSRRFELQEIARFFGIPPFMIGDSTASTTWGTGIEQQTLGFLNNCLDPHLVAWEQSLAISLLTTEEQRKGYYFQFDRDSLANADLAAKSAYFREMRAIGVYSVNDIRAKIHEPLLSDEQGGNAYDLSFNNQGGKATEPAAKAEPKQEPATT